MRWIYYAIIALPLLDIATGFTTTSTMSLGIIVRVLAIAVALVFFFKEKQALPFYIVFASLAVTFSLNFFLKGNFHFIKEAQFLFKTIYAVLILWLVVSIKTVNRLAISQAAVIASAIIGVTYWIAIWTNTSNPSYAYEQAGEAGWFFAANELGVIVLILLAITIYQFHETKKLSTLFVYSLLLTVIPMIGTKTALYGAILLIGAYLILHIKSIRPSFLIATSVLVLFLLPTTPPPNPAKVTEENPATNALLSSRDIYLIETNQSYRDASWPRKLFGLGYAGDYERASKTIEMDFYDLFYSYGVIGTISFALLFGYLFTKVFAWDGRYYLFLIALISGIAFTAGHVLFAPAVMSYFAISLLLLKSYKKEHKQWISYQ